MRNWVTVRTWSVLVVEQRASDAFLLRATLGEAPDWSFSITSCAPHEIRDVLTRDADFDVAIIGVEMRDVDALRWQADEIRAAAPLIPLVACPLGHDPELTELSAALGLTALLPKFDWKPELLASTIAFAASTGTNGRRLGVDAVTGLLTRMTWTDRIAHALERCRRTGQLVAVMLIDVDDFKRVNDMLGHDAGDRYLREIANRLRTTMREQDTIARLGGDEFGVLLEDVRYSEAAVRVANKVLRAMSDPIQLGMSSVPVSVSIGVVLGGGGHGKPTPEWLHKSADIALYRSKESGKNRVFLFTDEMEQGLLESFRFESAVSRGVNHNEFTLHYQPLLELGSGELLGFEALLRWGRGAHEGTGPSEFLPVLERMGLMPLVGRAVFAEAIAQLGRWNLMCDIQLSMHINLSAAQLVDPELPGVITDALVEHRVVASQLVIEITESTMMAHGEVLSDGFAELREQGVRIAIDDFGTGYNSMVNLKQFRPDVIKVDQQFVACLRPDDDDAVDLAIVRAQASLATTLGIELVAEGIENLDQLAVLQTIDGVEHGQGFYFGHPVAPKTLETSYRPFRERIDADRMQRYGVGRPDEMFLHTARIDRRRAVAAPA